MEIRSNAHYKQTPVFPIDIVEGKEENGFWSESRIISIDENGKILISWRDKEYDFVVQKSVNLTDPRLFNAVFNVITNYDSSVEGDKE